MHPAYKVVAWVVFWGVLLAASAGFSTHFGDSGLGTFFTVMGFLSAGVGAFGTIAVMEAEKTS